MLGGCFRCDAQPFFSLGCEGGGGGGGASVLGSGGGGGTSIVQCEWVG